MSGIGIDATYGGWISAGGAAPTLTATPQSGPWRATSVTFPGTNLSSTTGLTINGVAQTVTGSTSTSVTVTTSVQTANASGLNVVATTAAGNSGTSGNGIYSFLWDPLDATPNLWLDAGVGVTTSGSNVTAWNDQSGYGNHASASGTWTVVPSFANGKPALLADGTTGMSISTSAIFVNPASVGSILAVVADSSFAASGSGGTVVSFGGASQAINIHEADNGGFQWIYGDTTSVNEFVNNNRSPFASAVHCEWMLNGGGSNLTHYIAGSVQTINSGGAAAGPQASSGSFAAATMNVGIRGTSTYAWQKHILEIVVIRHVLSTAERAGWTAYAKTKYGLTS